MNNAILAFEHIKGKKNPSQGEYGVDNNLAQQKRKEHKLQSFLGWRSQNNVILPQPEPQAERLSVEIEKRTIRVSIIKDGGYINVD